MICAVDFDGTLCENNWPDIGKPKPGIISYLKDLQAHGNKLILWTCREGDDLQKAVEWCAGHGIHFDAAIALKHEYNKTRPYRHNGKKI